MRPWIVLLLLLSACAQTPGRFDFALIGDQQYNDESDAQFPRLMADVDLADVQFVVHLGDFKAGTTEPCDDALFHRRKAQFEASRHPFIYTPGDNEWTDCHNPKAGAFVPEERLAALRRIFFDGKTSLGQRKLEFEQQPSFPENLRWSRGDVLFLTLHIVGSNNNLDHAAEYRNRMAANVSWMQEAFRLAKTENAAAVAIFTQANPRFERSYPKGRVTALGIGPAPAGPSGYAEFLPVLEKEVVAFGRPVLFLHGDTHYLRIDKPLFRTGVFGGGERGRQVENFTRVEIYGFPEAHWLRVSVDPRKPAVFSFTEQIVPPNVYQTR